MNTKLLPKEPGVPYTMHDILMERVRFEEQLYVTKREVPPPTYKLVQKLKLSPVSAFVLGRQMIRKSLSIALP